MPCSSEPPLAPPLLTCRASIRGTFLQAGERTALEGDLLQLAAFHWHTGSVERARGLAERAQRQSQQPTAAATLLAWVILSTPAEEGAAGQQLDLREAEGLLGKALQQDPSKLQVG